MQIHPRPDIAAVRGLLAAADLPTQDITLDLLPHFFYAEIDGEKKGVIAAVPCGAHVLLRSLVVAAACRGKGLGSRLVAAAERHALNLGARGLYLLTQTAEGFFSSHGYQTVPRDKAPEAVRATAEFARICPASSVLMFKPLPGAE
ncbi:MAG: arsenic resistance N-acetyltransferase ArsN2 [Desulfosarcinaceae bacterium]|jgi:amino-acid N-acetyltransferase